MIQSGLNRVFIARLAGTPVFDPNGDQVGKVRDVVVTLRSNNQPPRVLGLAVEVPPRRRIFVPITRVTAIDNGTVVITGLLNMRRFEQRSTETLVIAEIRRNCSEATSPPESARLRVSAKGFASSFGGVIR